MLLHSCPARESYCGRGPSRGLVEPAKGLARRRRDRSRCQHLEYAGLQEQYKVQVAVAARVSSKSSCEILQKATLLPLFVPSGVLLGGIESRNH